MKPAGASRAALWCLALGALVQGNGIAAGAQPCSFPFQAPDIPWDAAAQLISGVSSTVYADPFTAEQKDAWTLYSRGVNTDWRRLKSQYLDRIGAWRSRTLNNFSTGKAGFYPFSGPDVANLLAFFPEEGQYIMIGLERVGCVPVSAADYTPAYFTDLRRSVRSIVALGFFRTVEMQRDFSGDGEGAVQGVLPALLLFLSRAGYSVVEVTPVGISRQGAVVPNLEQAKRETRGVAIQFKDARHGVRTLTYFSLNLQNSALERKPGTLRYLQGLTSADTLVKAASYLMHYRNFSTVRSAILSQSRIVVEDDSGIPFHFFDAATWDVHLYGTYTKPIALFKNSAQDDLREAFSSRPDVQPLEFGIGYRFRAHESNLILAFRRPGLLPAALRGK